MTRHLAAVLQSIDSQIRQARRVLIASDLDRALSSVSRAPGARPIPSMARILRSLAESPRVRLAVLSGQALDNLAQRLPAGVICAGNHGLEIRGCGIQFEHELARQLRPEMKRFCSELEPLVNSWPGAWIEDKGLSVRVHYREVYAVQHHALRCAVRRYVIGRNPFVRLRAMEMSLELYPRIGWGKAEALRYIMRKAGPFELCIAVGSDSPDESIFLPDADSQINIKVGEYRSTKARFQVAGALEVAMILEHVLFVCESADTETEKMVARLAAG